MTRKLPFISDGLLLRFVEGVLDVTSESASEEDIHRNTIDPFSAIFDAMRQDISLDRWLTQEKMRQTQKTLQNALGDFHHKVIGHMPRWDYIKTGGGYDVKCASKKVIAEIKNKFNTMNAGKSLEVYDSLSRYLDYDKSHKGYTAYVVHIVPKSPKPYSEPFTPSERGIRRQTREDIRVIDGKSFYNLATGSDNGLEQLYLRLPFIVGKATGHRSELIEKSKIYKNLFYRAYQGKHHGK